MTELVSRQAAIDALEREKTYCTAFRDGYTPINVFEKYNAGLTDGIKALKNLPSAQQWIPCSERLPEVNERCLCTYEFSEGTCVDFGLYMKSGWFVSGVTAWMPLPEPYKAERSEE